MNSLELLFFIAIGCMIVAVILAFVLRHFLERLLRRFNRRPRSALLHRDRLLSVMGERMERPWMPDELSFLTGYGPAALERYLNMARRKKLIRRNWAIHPATGEEYHAASLTPLGVQRFGMYAPSGSVTARQGVQDLSPVDLKDFVPDTGRLMEWDETSAEEDGPQIAPSRPSLSQEPSALPSAPAPQRKKGGLKPRRSRQH